MRAACGVHGTIKQWSFASRRFRTHDVRGRFAMVDGTDAADLGQQLGEGRHCCPQTTRDTQKSYRKAMKNRGVHQLQRESLGEHSDATDQWAMRVADL